MPDSKFFSIPFGTSGDRATIPEASQPNGAVSYQQGFGPDYERNPANDPLAKRVPRDETNEFYYQSSNAIKFLQLYGLPEWYAADGAGNPVSYPLTARVRYASKAWISIAANNTAQPGMDATKWVEDTAFNLPDLEASLAEMIAGSTGARIATPRRVAPVVQRGLWNYASAAGTPNAITAALALAPSALSDLVGARLYIKFSAPNTGPATLSVNGFAATPLVRPDGTPLRPSDTLAGGVGEVSYDGAKFQLLNPQSVVGFFQRIKVPATSSSSAVVADAGTMFYSVTGGSPTTIALPDASTMTGAYIGFFVNGGPITVTATPNGAVNRMLLPGALQLSSVLLPALYSFVFFYSDGINWVAYSVSPDLIFTLTQNTDAGYVRLPGGVLLQWGSVTIAPGTTAATFPVPFAGGGYSVQISPGDTGGSTYRFSAAPASLTQFNVTNTHSANVSGRWFAIGV